MKTVINRLYQRRKNIPLDAAQIAELIKKLSPAIDEYLKRRRLDKQ